MTQIKPWLIPRQSPFQIPGVQLFACEYDTNRVDFKDKSLSHIALPNSLANAVPKRKIEYVIGRYCAGEALKSIGIFESVHRALDRSPQWPNAICGSITHTHAFSMAIVGRQEKWTGLGIDSEFLSSHARIKTFTEQFITPSEFELGIKNGMTEEVWLFTVFSAKESLFKSLYPLVKNYFGFHDVRVVTIDLFNAYEGILNIRLNKSLPPVEKDYLIRCAYAIEPQYVHTLVAF